MPHEKISELLVEQLDEMCKRGLFRGVPRQHQLLRGLLAPDAMTRFDNGDSGHAITRDIYEAIVPGLTDPGEAAKKIVEKLRPRLNRYYDQHPGDPVVITIPSKTFCPKIEFRRNAVDGLGRQAQTIVSTDSGDHLDQLEELNAYSGLWHIYHVTADERGEFWSYSVVEFPPSSGDKKLITTAVWLPEKPQEDWSAEIREKYRSHHLYKVEASLTGRHFIMQVTKRGDSSDMAVQVFRHAHPHLLQPMGGLMVLTATWTGAPAVGTSILSRSKFGRDGGTIEGEPIRDPKVMQALSDEWKKRCTPEFGWLGPVTSPLVAASNLTGRGTEGTLSAAQDPDARVRLRTTSNAQSSSLTDTRGISGPARFWDPHLTNGLRNAILYTEPICFRLFVKGARLFIRDLDLNDTEPPKSVDEQKVAFLRKHRWLAERLKLDKKGEFEVSRAYFPGGEVFAKDALREWFERHAGRFVGGGATDKIPEFREMISHEAPWHGTDSLRNDNLIILGNLRANPKIREFYDGCKYLRLRLEDDGVNVANLTAAALETLARNGEGISPEIRRGKLRERWKTESIVLVTRLYKRHPSKIVTTSILANQGRGVEAVVEYFLTNKKSWSSMVQGLALSDTWPGPNEDGREFQMLFHVELEIQEARYGACTPLLYQDLRGKDSKRA